MSKRIAMIPMAILAILTGFYPSIYFLIDRRFGLLQSKSDALLGSVAWNAGFYTHILLGGLALLVGWTQFINRIRTGRPAVHKALGKIYVVSVALSGLAAFYIAFYATGGPVAMLGFGLLAIVWLGTTFKAYSSILKGRVAAHERWMIYSYAACFAAVMLRIYLPMLVMVYRDFNTAYRIVSWACWVPNMGVAWLINQRKRA